MSVQPPVTRYLHPLRTTLSAALLFTVVFSASAQALTLNNQEGAVIYSQGDLAIGGSLDANNVANPTWESTLRYAVPKGN
jgi:hypothetical protein